MWRIHPIFVSHHIHRSWDDGVQHVRTRTNLHNFFQIEFRIFRTAGCSENNSATMYSDFKIHYNLPYFLRKFVWKLSSLFSMSSNSSAMGRIVVLYDINIMDIDVITDH